MRVRARTNPKGEPAKQWVEAQGCLESAAVLQGSACCDERDGAARETKRERQHKKKKMKKSDLTKRYDIQNTLKPQIIT